MHAEVEVLKKAIIDKQNQLIAMENVCLRERDRQAELEDSIIAWQDKYERIFELHKVMLLTNQNLEDKLLKSTDQHSKEKAQLTSDVATLSCRLAHANNTIRTLQQNLVSIALQIFFYNFFPF